MLPTMKLGKRAPKHDARIPMLATYTAALPSAPVSVDWSAGVKSWGVMRNDVLGDCTCAAVGHAIQVWTKNTEQEQTLPDEAVVSLYSAVSGFTPDNPSSDQGAVETEVLNYWLRHKVEGHTLSAFAALQPRDIRDVKDAIWLFGGVYIGLALPISAQAQDVWVVPAAGLSGNGQPAHGAAMPSMSSPTTRAASPASPGAGSNA